MKNGLVYNMLDKSLFDLGKSLFNLDFNADSFDVRATSLLWIQGLPDRPIDSYGSRKHLPLRISHCAKKEVGVSTL